VELIAGAVLLLNLQQSVELRARGSEAEAPSPSLSKGGAVAAATTAQ